MASNAVAAPARRPEWVDNVGGQLLSVVLAMAFWCASHDSAHRSSTTGSAAIAKARIAATAILVARNIGRFYPTTTSDY
jgi:hypothetical protein